MSNNELYFKCISNDDCQSILKGDNTYVNATALLNIGWLVSNAILEAGEMIAEAIKSNKEVK